MSAVVRPGEAVPEPANDLAFQALVTAAGHGPDVSVTRVRIEGRHRRLRTDRSTRVYAVLDGMLELQVGDTAPEPMSAGDVAVVPRGTGYELNGDATYLVVNAPAFVEGDDVYEDRR